MFFTQKHKKEENWAKLCKKLIFQVCTLLCILISFRKLRAPESWPEPFLTEKLGTPSRSRPAFWSLAFWSSFFFFLDKKYEKQLTRKNVWKGPQKKVFQPAFCWSQHLLVTALESWSKYTTLSFRHLDLDLPYSSSQANFFSIWNQLTLSSISVLLL